MKFTYFGAHGRGLQIKMALTAGKIEFENEPLDFPGFGKAKAGGVFRYG
jgi:hypothetical protein